MEMEVIEFFNQKGQSRNQLIYKDKSSGIELWLKREDEIHPYISGNKFRKLKYNLIEAKQKGFSTLLTFGGAYSNHIAAVAEAAKLFDFMSIGIIRGDELAEKFPQLLTKNSTLARAHQNGMQFYFESRSNYRLKDSPSQLAKYEAEFGKAYVIPEGGTNAWAVKGCMEILSEEDSIFDFVCSSVGTGGTLAGIIEASKPHQQVIGFSALKGTFLVNEIEKWTLKTNWELQQNFHFGGYAKISEELIGFINQFSQKTKILLDPIYTGKMIYGLYHLIKTGYFSKNTRILAIHTGGLQGVENMNKKYKNHPSKQIKFN